MASFTFNIDQFKRAGSSSSTGTDLGLDEYGNAKQFTVSGPPGLTREQALVIFEKQFKSGGLTGFKPGEVLNAATQAADGLTSARSQLGAGVTSIGAAVSKITTGITQALKDTAVVNGINAGNFVKQLPGLTNIDKLNPNQVTGTLAQAAKSLGQPVDLLSNTKGVGNFGLDPKQLEIAGYIKPGITNKYLATGQNSVTSVLSSPAVWTGKDGINQVKNLLTSPTAQNNIQQQLMTQGIDQVKTLGLPVDSLSPSLVSGIALNAAKNVTATVDWAKGQTENLPAVLAQKFDQNLKNGEFAVKLVDEKLGEETLGIKEVVGSAKTVDRSTLNAAFTRIVGNEKIPAVNFSGNVVDTALELALKTLAQKFGTAEITLNNVINEPITVNTVDAREARLNPLKTDISAVIAELKTLKASAISPVFITKIDKLITNAQIALDLIDVELLNIQQFKSALQSI